MLGWPPSEAEVADASDIIIALRAHSENQTNEVKAYGRLWGVKFSDDQQAKAIKTEATQLIKQMFGAPQR